MLLRVVARSRQCIDMSGNIALGHKMQTYRAPRTVRKGEEREVPRPVDRAIRFWTQHISHSHMTMAEKGWVARPARRWVTSFLTSSGFLSVPRLPVTLVPGTAVRK